MKKYLLIAAIGAFSFTACNSVASNSKPEETSVTANENKKDEHAMLGVQGLCEMCKERIEKAAKDVKGVSSATWDMEKKELHLNFDPSQTSLDAISKAIAKAGHDTDKDKADQSTYDALPGCCQYR